MSTVTFYDDGATTKVSPSNMRVPTNSLLGSLPKEPEKTSYTFSGWYTEMNGKGENVTKTTKIKENITVFACWKIKDKDGNEYTEVTIGNQVWMVENFRCTQLDDRESIPHVNNGSEWVALTSPGYCFYENNTDPDFQKKWGALYNWYTVSTKKLAPKGWHVPTDEDWKTLENYLITNGYNWDDTKIGNKIGKSLASKTDWASSTVTGTPGNNPSENNKCLFSALPGGYRGYIGNCYEQTYSGSWWSATEVNASDAGRYNLSRYIESLDRFEYYKTHGFSVRLVRDY